MTRPAHHYAWAFIERAAPMVVSFVAAVAIARLVDPAAYGLLAMLGIFMAMGQGLTELGFSAAIIQRRSISQVENSTVFYINVVAGLLVTVALWLLSPLVAAFFGHQRLALLLSVQSIGILVASASIVHFALFSRLHQFKLIAQIELAATALSAGAGLSAAYAGWGVWSLVVLALSREVVRTLLAWLLSSWRPGKVFSGDAIKELWGYSGKLLYASMFHRVVSNAHTVIIGKVFAPDSLGLFTRAQSLQNLPGSLLTGMIQRVAFPAFSRLQDDHGALRENLRAMLGLLACAMSYLMALLSLVARDLVILLLGPNWTGAGPLLEILAAAGVLAALFPILSQATMALGRSSDFLRAELLKKVAVLVILVVAVQFGLKGFAYGLILISVSDYVLSARPVRTAIGYRWRQQAWDVLPWVVFAFGLAAALRGLGLDPGYGEFGRILVQSLILTAAYSCIALVWKRDELRRAAALLMGTQSPQPMSLRSGEKTIDA